MLKRSLDCRIRGSASTAIVRRWKISRQRRMLSSSRCHCAQPSRTRKNWTNREARKKPAYQKRSHISLPPCCISERAFVHYFADGLYKWFGRYVGPLQRRLNNEGIKHRLILILNPYKCLSINIDSLIKCIEEYFEAKC